MTRMTVHVEELESFLGFLPDKADPAYQPEVENAIRDYLKNLDGRQEAPAVYMEPVLSAVQVYMDSFYMDFTTAFKVEAKTYPTGKVAVLSVHNPDSPSDKPKILAELEGATQEQMEQLKDVRDSLLDEFE